MAERAQASAARIEALPNRRGEPKRAVTDERLVRVISAHAIDQEKEGSGHEVSLHQPSNAAGDQVIVTHRWIGGPRVDDEQGTLKSGEPRKRVFALPLTPEKVDELDEATRDPGGIGREGGQG